MAVTVVILFVLLVGDFVDRPAHPRAGASPTPLTIKVTGHQWWWEVRYDDPTPSNIVTTANEIHIPVGRTVQFELDSADVIHSFWVPNLHGKKDLIPGHPTRTCHPGRPARHVLGPVRRVLRLPAREHALRRSSPSRRTSSDEWLAAQRQPAPEPTTDEPEARAAGLPRRSTCVMCHTIQGTPAAGRVGPDLTHVASRPRIAAGTLPNTRGQPGRLGRSTRRASSPGVRMPPNPLTPDELQALLDYLESLK